MIKLLTLEDKNKIAAEFDIEYRALNAVFMVESSGHGFDTSTGKIKIQFEPHWFLKYTGIKVQNGIEGQSAEWAAYNKATAINSEAANKSTSWGLGQVMGFNFKSAGYDSVHDMINSFIESETNQLKGMLTFIKTNPVMYEALKRKDWATFAKYYNGPQYLEFKYDTRLAESYNKS